MSRPKLLVLAVALHNIPEGMALGVVIAAAMGDAGMSWTAALVFGAGLALQNFPEGMAVVLPLRQSGATQRHCLRWGFWASLAEPAAAIIGILMTTFLATLGGVVMPVLLSVAAGAMIFIVVERIIPESQSGDHGHAGHLRLSAGLLADGPAGRFRWLVIQFKREEHITHMEKITWSNGLRLLLLPVEGALSASVGVWIEAGSRYEPGVRPRHISLCRAYAV